MTRSPKKPSGREIPTYYNEFHEVADPIYEKFSLDDREPEFKKLYQHLFAKWGFADILRDGFSEFPDLKEKIGIVLVRGVLKEDQEGVDILRKWGSVEEKLARQFEEKGQKGRWDQVDSPAVLRPGH